ncbi:MAG: hypothetical protein FWF46_08165 [Oscillospiraceae bacterium]|nr:hypothetical protein [Oscillospiraceae bacterium]
MNIGKIISVIFMLFGFTLILSIMRKSNIIFYIIFGLFFFLGAYLALKALKFKVIVQGEDISVYDIFIKTYTFKFDDIVLVTRQVKKNQLNSERMVIKTKLGKKLIVESAEIAYKCVRRISKSTRA